MIRLGTTILLAGCAAVLLPIPSDTAALAGLVVMGIGCAPVYPSIIHATPANFGEKNSQAIIGIQMASAYVGSTFMPPVFGQDIPAGAVIEKKTKNEGRLFHKP